MPAIVCLIADPARFPLERRLVEAVAAALRGELRWLAADEAAEVATERAVDPERLDGLLGDAAIDRVVLPVPDRRKRLLVCDMDSTVITIECIDELADFAGIKAEVAAVTRRAMNGELDFAAALRQRVALLAGLPQRAIAEVIAERLRLMPGARTLVGTMRAQGAFTALVSGGFTAFTGHVRQLCGFDLDEANELEVADGRLTGRLVGKLRGAAAKRTALARLTAELGLDRRHTLAAGDGANDLPMLQAAGVGAAFRAHPRVRADAPARIDHGDLTALLYIQGFRRDEFAAPA